MLTEALTFKKAFVLFLAFLLLAGSFGLSHATMNMDMEGNMTDCPFMPGVSICTMTPMEMIAASQSLLSDVTLAQDPFLLLLLAGVLILTVFPSFLSPPRSRIRYRIPKRGLVARFDFLEEAFSDGILNPKLF